MLIFKFLKFLAISFRQFFNFIISLMRLKIFLSRERLMFNMTFVYVKDLFLWFHIWITNDENAINLINQLFFEEREECVIEEFFSNLNVISSSILNLILSIYFDRIFFSINFFVLRKLCSFRIQHVIDLWRHTLNK